MYNRVSLEYLFFVETKDRIPVLPYGQKALTDGFSRLMENTIVPSVKKGYSATVFTQLSDIEEETNGLITYDRKKIKMNPLIVQKWNTKLKKSLHS